MNARYDNQEAILSIHVVDGVGPDLVGRDWLQHFKVSIQEVNHVNQSMQPLQDLLSKHSAVFNNDLGCMKNTEITLHVKPDAIGLSS